MTRKKFNQKIYLFLELLFALIEICIVSRKQEKKTDSILIIKLDGIGDYILIRNFFKEIVKDPNYKEYNFYLLGNQLWKNLAESLDSNIFQGFFWLDPNKYMFKPLYRIRTRLWLTKHSFDQIINPTYSRFFTFDLLVKSIKANKKIASSGDKRNSGFIASKLSQLIYTQNINRKTNTLFEFYRNKEFFSNLLNKDLVTELIIENKTEPIRPAPYIVVFPDAAVSYRKWNPKNFGSVCNQLIDIFKLNVVIVGLDKIAGKSIVNQCHINNKSMITDLTYKTNLSELIPLLKNAEFVLSNDSGIVHMSAALNTKVFCISNGNHYCRFVPYPQSMHKDILVILPNKILKKYPSEEAKITRFKNGSLININELSVMEVITIIKKNYQSIKS